MPLKVRNTTPSPHEYVTCTPVIRYVDRAAGLLGEDGKRSQLFFLQRTQIMLMERETFDGNQSV